MNNLTLVYRETFVYICTQRDDVHRIQQRCFIYRSIFAVQALHKRRVQGYCAAYHFRIFNIWGVGVNKHVYI